MKFLLPLFDLVGGGVRQTAEMKNFEYSHFPARHDPLRAPLPHSSPTVSQSSSLLHRFAVQTPFFICRWSSLIPLFTSEHCCQSSQSSFESQNCKSFADFAGGSKVGGSSQVAWYKNLEYLQRCLFVLQVALKAPFEHWSPTIGQSSSSWHLFEVQTPSNLVPWLSLIPFARREHFSHCLQSLPRLQYLKPGKSTLVFFFFKHTLSFLYLNSRNLWVEVKAYGTRRSINAGDNYILEY